MKTSRYSQNFYCYQPPGGQSEVVLPSKERLSLFEALGLAKDLTIYARRDNILITRETEDGKLMSMRVDLTKPDVFSSPGFYLQKGDVVYVEPNDYRKSNSSYNSNKQFNVSMISTIISGVSVIASLIIALFVK